MATTRTPRPPGRCCRPQTTNAMGGVPRSRTTRSVSTSTSTTRTHTHTRTSTPMRLWWIPVGVLRWICRRLNGLTHRDTSATPALAALVAQQLHDRHPGKAACRACARSPRPTRLRLLAPQPWLHHEVVWPPVGLLVVVLEALRRLRRL